MPLPPPVAFGVYHNSNARMHSYFILTEIFGWNQSHEKLIRKFFHPITIANRLSHTWEKPFHPIRNQLSE